MSGPQQFRKKPVVIEAMCVEPEGDDRSDAWCDAVRWVNEGGGQARAIGWDAEDGSFAVIAIDTLEGTMEASVGDWVIRGVAGEFYPCKPEIFDATYEPVAARSTPTESPK